MDWISLLPPSWQPAAHSLVAISVAVSVALLGLKPLFGDPSPGDPAWKRLAFEVLHYADFVATNSAPVASPSKIVELKAASIPPSSGEL
jgi:hypothetical protein